MKLIKTVKIKNFRSLKNVVLENLNDFNVLMGANNSGKSNVLRALNLFFNNEVERDERLNIRRDCSAREATKKEIIVTVDFKLPPVFSFGKRSKHIEGYLGREFTISKRWTLDTPEPELFYRVKGYNKEKHAILFGEKEKINQFLNMIVLRYIPSHRDPRKLLFLENENVRQILINKLEWHLTRLNYKKGSAARAGMNVPFDILTKAAQKAFGGIFGAVKGLFPEIRAVDLTLPKEIADIVFSLDYEVKLNDGTDILSESQGSGSQTYMLFRILELIDSNLPQRSYGWKQAIIWVVEEPESFLHKNLELKTAHDFREISNTKDSRFQLVASTHSCDVAQFANSSYFLSLKNNRTTIEPIEVKDLLERAFAEGVAGYLHPLLAYRNEPLIFFEGKTDVIIMNAVYRAIGEIPPGRLISLDYFDRTRSGGDDTLVYIKNYRDLLSKRPLRGPVVVVWDWDKQRKTEQTKAFLNNVHDTSFSLKFDEASSNQHLSRNTFRGIEKFLSDRLILLGDEEGCFSISKPRRGSEYPLSITDTSDFNKVAFAELVKREGLENDFTYFEDILRRLNKHLLKPTTEYPLYDI